ncbi:hypothetical protein [Amycolatopsis eburnea]|uniref:Uncharacterized protein n=1 Tax=Amycolatopsis eburnea TaxID=2267691 RepID=A0A3R9E1R1_9PSEU|nr:hypothetical protein [Amycolatopsis eburnea]RSD20121.1 hypothetical protein EIY87_18095 [Amycolatopsis eburnea]
MPSDDENLSRKVRKLAVEHAETRWLALRIDDDVKELREDLRTVQRTQQEHTGRFDSLDLQLRSLTQLVGQVLERLPAPGDEPDESTE